MQNNNRLLYIISGGVVLILLVFFGLNYFLLKSEVNQLSAQQEKAALNTKVLDFTSLFVKKVLQANSTVDFDTRLQLENSVRDLKDDQIMAAWQEFVGSKTEAAAQNAVKNLLSLLVSKIQK